MKLRIRELGSETLRSLLGTDRGSQIVVSVLLRVELSSALARRTREQSLDSNMLPAIERELLGDYSRALRWDVRDELLGLAAELVYRQPLRTLDSLQLASALQVKQFLGHEDDLLFIASDHRLLACAAAEGLETWDPESGPPPVNFTR